MSIHDKKFLVVRTYRSDGLPGSVFGPYTHIRAIEVKALFDEREHHELIQLYDYHVRELFNPPSLMASDPNATKGSL